MGTETWQDAEFHSWGSIWIFALLALTRAGHGQYWESSLCVVIGVTAALNRRAGRTPPPRSQRIAWLGMLAVGWSLVYFTKAPIMRLAGIVLASAPFILNLLIGRPRPLPRA